MMKALLYDYLQVTGGAERVTLTLALALPDHRVIVSRVYPEVSPLLSDVQIEVEQLGTRWTRPLYRIPEAIVNFKYRCGRIKGAQSVLYSGFYAPLAVHAQERGRRIYYCHTIPRFAYDLYERERANISLPLRWLFDLATAWLRREYRAAIHRMDVVLVNSENVRRRMLEHLGIDASVVYPPVATHRFTWRGDGDVYVSPARLVANKRVDVIVEAFKRMPDKQLVVLSGGPELERLRALAAGVRNIEFAGWQSEDALRDWLGRARAAIYLPVDEDFGLSPVEAMACGKPVIGVAQGGLLETVVDGETGLLIHGEPTAAKLCDAVRRLESMDVAGMREACERRAALFSETVFLERIHAVMQTPSVAVNPPVRA
jgi:glycosyltransferase involved in cell wall biosynthesis